MRLVRLKIQLENLARFRIARTSKESSRQAKPIRRPEPFDSQAGVPGFLDLVAIDNQRSAIGSDGFRRRGVGLLEHFRLYDLSVDYRAVEQSARRPI